MHRRDSKTGSDGVCHRGRRIQTPRWFTLALRSSSRSSSSAGSDASSFFFATAQAYGGRR
eukprot:8800180-Prorocentrum_lima.AAC.1